MTKIEFKQIFFEKNDEGEDERRARAVRVEGATGTGCAQCTQDLFVVFFFFILFDFFSLAWLGQMLGRACVCVHVWEVVVVSIYTHCRAAGSTDTRKLKRWW